MRRADLISDIETSANVGNTYRNLLVRAMTTGLKRYATAHPWPHYRDRRTIQTLEDYTTGTVDVTNGSTTVTGTGTAFTAGMAGRKFRVANEQAFYDVASFDSTTQLTLTQAYQGDTDSDLSYAVFQDEYKLDNDVYRLLNLRQTEDGILMVALSYLEHDRWFPSQENYDDPLWYSVIGRRADRYTTGTISGTAGESTITGSSTAWTTPQGISKGTRLAIHDTNEVLTVKSVDSATQITVYEAITTTFTDSDYTLFLNNLIVQLSDVPDEQRNLYYRCHRLPEPFVNDYDEPDMPGEHHYLLVWYGLSVLHGLLGNLQRAQDAERKFLTELSEQWSQLASTTPSLIMVKESMDWANYPGVGALRYPSHYGSLLP